MSRDPRSRVDRGGERRRGLGLGLGLMERNIREEDEMNRWIGSGSGSDMDPIVPSFFLFGGLDGIIRSFVRT
jgi:hypothetical protein